MTLPRRTPRPATIDRAIFARWKFWTPWVEIAHRKCLTVASATDLRIDELQSLHRTRCLALLRAHIRWATIRRMSLDDPAWDADTFSRALVAATRRKIRHRNRGTNEQTAH